ncbi:MAG: Crp/Fnr family transcriptional regulator [Bacteroidota bacterium]
MNAEDVLRPILGAATEPLLSTGMVKSFPANTPLIREGEYLPAVPLVIEGLVKVYSLHEDRELLLYYLQPGESCIMSFSACRQQHPSKIMAQTEVDSTLLFLPAEHMDTWMQEYPQLRTLFYLQYDQRYEDLLDTIGQVLFTKMDERLLAYLLEKAQIHETKQLELSHKAIAHDLGTAREVVTRLLKKLEHQGYLVYEGQNITLL